MSKHATPDREGHFWGKQRLTDWLEPDEIELIRSVDEWEVFQVFENHINDGDPDQWRVFVPGRGKSESVDNFYWGPQVILPDGL